MSFRLNARNIFLTYPHCDKLAEDLLSWLIEDSLVVKARTVSELHEDGSPHLHAVIKYSKKKDCRNERAFDYCGYHPNIQSAKNFAKSWNYLAKSGEPCDFESDDCDDEGFPDANAFGNKSDYLITCYERGVPFGYANELWRLHERLSPPIIDVGDVKFGPVRSELAGVELGDADRSTLILGPSGVGKSQLAISLVPKPALIASHIDDLKHLTPDIKGIIFDDMDFNHWPRTSQIHLVDTELDRSINVRYGTIRIPRGICKIFTANERPFILDPAVERRLSTFLIIV